MPNNSTSTTAANVPGRRGITRESWQDEGKLRGMLRKLREDHCYPNDISREDLQVKYLAKVVGRSKLTPTAEALIMEGMTRIFDNDMLTIDQQDRDAAPMPRRRGVVTDAVTIADELVTIVMFDQPMPNGKPLRQCTKAEVKSYGGGYVRIANEMAGDDDLVETCFASNDELTRVFKGL